MKRDILADLLSLLAFPALLVVGWLAVSTYHPPPTQCFAGLTWQQDGEFLIASRSPRGALIPCDAP